MRRKLPARNAGQKTQPPRYRFETSDYDQLHVIYVSRGRLFFESRGGKQTLGPGDLVLMREGSAFGLHTRSRGYGGVFFAAAGTGRPEFRGRAVALSADAGARTLAAMMEGEIASPGEGSDQVLLGLGRALAWRALRQSRRPAEEDEKETGRYWAECARAALEATLYAGRGARDVLAPLGISYRHLARHFSAHLGISPKKYQIRARVREARRLLAETRLLVTAIAFELGYPSSQHFAAQFRRVTGRSPSEWRTRPARRGAGATGPA